MKRRAPKPKRDRPSKLPDAPKRTRKGPPRNKRYLDYIRSQPCLFPGCEATAQAHHYGESGYGQTGSDFETAPLCFFHHQPCWHDDSCLPGMTTEESRELIHSVGARLRAEWFDRQGKGFGAGGAPCILTVKP